MNAPAPKMYANPRKTSSALQLGEVDIAALREAVLRIPEELWNLEDASKPNRFATLDRTRHIVFRFVQDLQDWRTDYERPLWREWQPLLQPVLDAAVRPYGYARGVFPRVMLARMAAGGVIQPHRDNMPAALWPHKIHVPLFTNERVGFYIEPKTWHFPVGRAVEVNNLGVHAVKNEGDSERIHLIFEYYDPDQPSWLDGAA